GVICWVGMAGSGAGSNETLDEAPLVPVPGPRPRSVVAGGSEDEAAGVAITVGTPLAGVRVGAPDPPLAGTGAPAGERASAASSAELMRPFGPLSGTSCSPEISSASCAPSAETASLAASEITASEASLPGES